MNLNEVYADEKLYRVVNFLPDFWDEDFKRPSSALFKTKKGVSVDRDGGRDEQLIVEQFKERFRPENVRAVVKIGTDKCIEIGVYVKPVPLPDNIFHAEIHESQDRIPISSSKARALSRSVLITYLA